MASMAYVFKWAPQAIDALLLRDYLSWAAEAVKIIDKFGKQT